jgi:hypothetical protein
MPELDAVLHHAYYVRKFLMRSTIHDFIAVITTNENTPFIVILPGKGVWLPKPRATPYIHIVDMAFLGDKLYAITKAENLIPFDLGLDKDGSPMVTIGRRVIRQPLDYVRYEWWPASYDEEEQGVEDEEVVVDVPADEEEEEVANLAIVADDEHVAEALDVLVDDYEEYGQAVADDDDGRTNINFMGFPYDNISEDEIVIWNLVESRGKLLMVKPYMHTPPDFSTPSIRHVEVFQADFEIGEWVPMANGMSSGRALFIGPGFSKSISAPFGDVAEGDIYLIESGEVFNVKTPLSNLKRFRKPFYLGTCGMWLFPPVLVV